MSNNPVGEERLDNDPTDELPILLETAVLDPDEHGVTAAVSLAGEEDTGEHTALFTALATAEPASGNFEVLRARLGQRDAKVATLESELSRLSSQQLESERQLAEKSASIAALDGVVTSLRASLAE